MRSLKFKVMFVTGPIILISDLFVNVETQMQFLFLFNRYSICIRQEEGFCCIQYFPCNDANSFTLDNGMGTTKAAVAAPKAGHDSICTLDYIAIPGK